MSSSLRVNTIVPSTGTNVAIGTANGTVTFTDSVNFVLGTGSSIFSPASNTLTFGTNDAERLRITSAGRIGINQTSPEAMLQVDYDYANSEVGLRLRAASGSGTKTWQLSEINGNAGVFTIRNATNAQNILNIDGVNQRVGVNNTSPDHKVSVFDAGYCGLELKSNRSTATDNIGGLHFKTQSTNVAYIQSLVDGTINFRNTSSLTERLRITSGGSVAIGGVTPSDKLHVGGNNAFIRVDRPNGNPGLTLIYNSTNSTRADIDVTTGGDLRFATNNSTERLRIDSSGHVRVNTGDLRVGDDTDSNAGSQTISVGSVSSGSGGIGIFANPTNGNSFVQFGDGTSSADQYRGYMNYRHADDSLRFGTAGTDRLHIYANGKIHLGNGYIASNNLTRLHVGWNTGGTVAGESIIAGTLGNDTTAVSALLTMKNAGNRGAQGASGGSSLAKFEFNNGTAFEIDKYGRRTLPYQPACKLTIDTNSQGGGNHAQTGRTILPFNSTGYGYNTGNHYNLTTHTFTCPLNGKYLVILSVNVIGDNIAYIYKNGSIHSAGEFRSNPNGVWEHMEISTVVDCSANDTIQPYSQMTGSGRKFNGGNQPGSYWDTLSIYYLG